MKLLTVFLVFFILGFDFATPQGNKEIKNLRGLIKKLVKQNENDFNKLNGKLTNIQNQQEDNFDKLMDKFDESGSNVSSKPTLSGSTYPYPPCTITGCPEPYFCCVFVIDNPMCQLPGTPCWIFQIVTCNNINLIFFAFFMKTLIYCILLK